MKNIYFLLIMVLSVQLTITAQDACTKLASKKLEMKHSDRLKPLKEFYPLLQCGLDSIDLQIAAQMTASRIIDLINSKKEVALTYGQILAAFKAFTENGPYEQTRTAIITERHQVRVPPAKPFYDSSLLCDAPLFADRYDPFNNHPQYFDYDQALGCAKIRQKNVLVYFTCQPCVSSRQMEAMVFADPAIDKWLMENVVIATLYVDGYHSNEKKNAAMQRKWGNVGQPDLYLMDSNGKLLRKLGGYRSRQAFLELIQTLQKPTT